MFVCVTSLFPLYVYRFAKSLWLPREDCGGSKEGEGNVDAKVEALIAETLQAALVSAAPLRLPCTRLRRTPRICSGSGQRATDTRVTTPGSRQRCRTSWQMVRWVAFSTSPYRALTSRAVIYSCVVNVQILSPTLTSSGQSTRPSATASTTRTLDLLVSQRTGPELWRSPPRMPSTLAEVLWNAEQDVRAKSDLKTEWLTIAYEIAAARLPARTDMPHSPSIHATY